MNSQTRDEIRNTGTIHLVAASGLQVVLIGQILFWILGHLPIPRWGQLVILGFVLAIYALATGLSPSIVRAAIMTLIANSAYLARREPDWPSALGLSSILYLLYDPSSVYSKGFQFTVLAVLFISLFSPHLKWKPGLEAALYRTAMKSVWTGVIAWVVVMPLVAYHFGVVSLVSIPSCLVVVVAAVPVVILSMIALPLSWVFPAVGALLIRLSAPLLSTIGSMLSTFGGDSAIARVPPFSAYWLVPFYVLLIMLWRPRVRQP